MGPQIQGFSPKTRAERPQNHQNSRKNVVFWSIKGEIRFWTEKKSKKKELDPSTGRGRRVAGTMYNVGGRVREGRPSLVRTKYEHDSRTPNRGGGLFNRSAHSAGPTRMGMTSMTALTSMIFSLTFSSNLYYCSQNDPWRLRNGLPDRQNRPWSVRNLSFEHLLLPKVQSPNVDNQFLWISGGF